MIQPARFSFAPSASSQQGVSSLPFAPILLSSGTQSIPVSALVDTGAAMSVLPYSAGRSLGLVWEQQLLEITLTGNLNRTPARITIVDAVIASFAPVRLVFAWSQSDETPVILGQINFFAEFDVCFFRAQSAFEITPKQGV